MGLFCRPDGRGGETPCYKFGESGNPYVTGATYCRGCARFGANRLTHYRRYHHAFRPDYPDRRRRRVGRGRRCRSPDGAGAASCSGPVSAAAFHIKRGRPRAVHFAAAAVTPLWLIRIGASRRVPLVSSGAPGNAHALARSGFLAISLPCGAQYPPCLPPNFTMPRGPVKSQWGLFPGVPPNPSGLNRSVRGGRDGLSYCGCRR